MPAPKKPPVATPKPAPATKPAVPSSGKVLTSDTVLCDPDDAFPLPIPPKREFRAAWIATVDNIDWPSRKGLPTASQQRELTAMFDQQQQMGLNAVVVQVRPAADAFYARSSEPWSEWLTGQQGLPPDPFYDPLEFMIEQAHVRGMEFHAWFNLDRATYSPRASIAPSNIIYRKPEWLLSYGGRKLFNLGLPAVRTYVAGIVANVVRQYDVDGIHFDDYFYPYAEPGQVLRDDSAYVAFGNGMSKGDWRRDNVNRLIRELRDSIRANKPWVKFGISPFGIWKNKRNDPDGSDTDGGEAYYEIYADTRQWVREGLIDYIVPQVYFSTQFRRVPYTTLVEWWTRHTSPTCHLYIGQGAYRVSKGSERDPGWWAATEFPDQIRFNRAQPAIQGSVFFSAKNLQQNPLAIRDSLQQRFYKFPALPPTMPWLDSIPPMPPRELKLALVPEGVELQWHPPGIASDGDQADSYVIYRFEGTPTRLLLNDPRRIVARCIGEQTTQFVDRTAQPDKLYVYVVTAVDRLGNESKPMRVNVRH